MDYSLQRYGPIVFQNPPAPTDYTSMAGVEVAEHVGDSPTLQQEYLADVDARIESASSWARSPEDASVLYERLRTQLLLVMEEYPQGSPFYHELGARLERVDSLRPDPYFPDE